MLDFCIHLFQTEDSAKEKKALDLLSFYIYFKKNRQNSLKFIIIDIIITSFNFSHFTLKDEFHLH